MIRQRNIAHRTAIDVQLLGLCTAIGCIANVQVIHASFFNIDCQLNGFASIFHVNDFTAACTFHVFFFHRSSGNLATFKFILCFSGSGNATEKRADANSIQCHCSCQAGSKYFFLDLHGSNILLHDLKKRMISITHIFIALCTIPVHTF